MEDEKGCGDTLPAPETCKEEDYETSYSDGYVAGREDQTYRVRALELAINVHGGHGSPDDMVTTAGTFADFIMG